MPVNLFSYFLAEFLVQTFLPYQLRPFPPKCRSNACTRDVYFHILHGFIYYIGLYILCGKYLPRTKISSFD